MTVACDYSFARPSLTELKRCSYVGVMRYLYSPVNGKVISLAEARAIWAAGLQLGLVWEGGAQEAQGGYNAGVNNARAALALANGIGWPASRPIYFVAEDPNTIPTSEWPAAVAYFQGIVAVLGVARVGAYGGQSLLEHLQGLGLARWFWQVGGWSRIVHGDWHLYQRLSTTVASPLVAGSIDEDAVLAADWGGWDGKAVAAQAPAPTTAPTKIGAPIAVGSDIVSSVISGQTTLDGQGSGYIATGLPAGKTFRDIVAIRVDWAGPADQNPPTNYPDECIADVDVGSPAGQARVIFRHGRPNGFYTFRIFIL